MGKAGLSWPGDEAIHRLLETTIHAVQGKPWALQSLLFRQEWKIVTIGSIFRPTYSNFALSHYPSTMYMYNINVRHGKYKRLSSTVMTEMWNNLVYHSSKWFQSLASFLYAYRLHRERERRFIDQLGPKIVQIHSALKTSKKKGTTLNNASSHQFT